MKKGGAESEKRNETEAGKQLDQMPPKDGGS
jgi:hypothetical protein